jgi:hypothetical protein
MDTILISPVLVDPRYHMEIKANEWEIHSIKLGRQAGSGALIEFFRRLDCHTSNSIISCVRNGNINAYSDEGRSSETGFKHQASIAKA